MLAVPLVRENRILGALVVRRRMTGEFSEQITDLLETFASQSALAIHNARLFQELALKTHELEIASRHKSEFLASMSHELRTPLNAVIGFSEVLLDRLFGELNAKQEEYLEDIRGSGTPPTRAAERDPRPLQGRGRTRWSSSFERVSVREALEHGVAMVRERASRQGLTLDVVVDPDVDVVVADPLRLKQVILNLLTNAVKFTPPGGFVSRHELARVGGEVQVSVEDSGIGIAEEYLERIFESFQQGPRSVSGATEGTGLGLTLSKRIVELHGGRLWVESASDRAARSPSPFPLRARPDSGSGDRREERLAGELILIVEDNERNLKLLRDLLARARLPHPRGAIGEEARVRPR